MRLLLFLMIAVSQQLTWYEVYERGEKRFSRGEYQACIDDMDAALAEKQEPKRNQITRAVQKINYKPFYYKALAYYRLNDLNNAFTFTRLAYQGEVVAESPKLQADLAEILEAYRRQVQEMHDAFEREQAIIEERSSLVDLISRGRIEEAEQVLQKTAYPAEHFADIAMQLSQEREYQQRRGEVRAALLERIDHLLDNGDRETALSLFDSLRDTLPGETVRLLQQRFDALPPVQAETPSQPEQPPEEDTPKVAVQPDEDSARLQAEIETFKTRLENLRSEKADLSERVAGMEKENRELSVKLQESTEREPVSFAPQLFLILEKVDTRRLKIEAHAVSPLLVKDWGLELNGQVLGLPGLGLKRDNANFRLDHELEIDHFGAQELRFFITDELGTTAEASETIWFPMPWYLNRLIWFAVVALLAIGTVLTVRTRIIRRRLARMRHFNPYIAGSPVRIEEMFYGRDVLISRIQGLVHKNSFMIHGARRIGKTSMLLQLKKNLAELESDHYRFFPAFIDLQGIHEEELFHHMMAEVLMQAGEWEISLDELSYTDDAGRYQSRQFSRDIKKLLARLMEKEDRHIMVVLLMDEVDVLNEFGEKTNQKLRGIFMKDFAEHLTCVMAGIHLKKEWESAGSPWYNFFEEVPMNPFDEGDARALILEPVKGVFRYEKAAIDLIVNHTGGHPYLIQKICVSLITEKLQFNRFLVTREDVEATLERMSEEIKRNQV